MSGGTIRLMESAIEEIKKKIDIVSFIGQYAQLKKAGRNFKALCPFHQEKTASFIVSPDRQIWHCFGSCGDGGDIIKFLMKLEGITFTEAVGELASSAGIELQTVQIEDREWDVKQRILRLNTLACDYFEYLLHNTSFAKKAREYLEERKINPAVVKKFQLGYAPSSWDSLNSFLKRKKFNEREMYDAGLLVKTEKGTYYDRFRGRLMFPIKDIRGNVIGFSGRILDPGDKQSKYINTPETLIYHKRESLYGISIAKESIKKEGNVVLVEGEFDVITPYQAGFENFVAIKGSAVTMDQLTILKRLTSRITLALDADAAGEEAVRRAIEAAEALEIDVYIVQFENGKDPDEAVRVDSSSFKKALVHPMPVYDFVIQIAQKKYPEDNAYHKKRIGEEIIPSIARIKNPIVQSHYIKKIAGILGVSEESVQTSLKKTQIRQKQYRPIYRKNRSSQTQDRSEVLQKYLLGLFFQSEKPSVLAKRIFSTIEIDDLSIPALRKICQMYFDYQTKHADNIDIQLFIKNLPSELKVAFDEVFLFSSSDLDIGSINMDKLVLEIKKNALKRKIAALLQTDGGHYPAKDTDLLHLSQALKEVEKRITSV